MKIQIIASLLALFLVVDSCSALGLLGGLGYGNPMMGCGCGLSGYGLPPSSPFGLGYPGTCCLSVTKPPCLLSKLLMLKKKLLAKKMSLLGCGCGGCGLGCGLL